MNLNTEYMERTMFNVIIDGSLLSSSTIVKKKKTNYLERKNGGLLNVRRFSSIWEEESSIKNKKMFKQSNKKEWKNKRAV